MTPVEYIPYKQIAEASGIRQGDTLMLASGLTLLAFSATRREGQFSVDTFIDSIIEQLGETGTLIIPAYNHKLKRNGSFDIRRSKPLTGILAETSMKRDDFIRTQHPLHSFIVWGKHSQALAELKNISSFGQDSPFAFMHDHDARMLMLGTTVTEAFTYTHFVEEQEKVRYRKYRRYLINYTDRMGYTSRKEFLLFRKKKGWTMNMLRLEKMLDAIALQQGKINGVGYSLLSLKQAHDIILDDIRNNNAASIARFDAVLFVREHMKRLLNLLSYRTVSDKINNDTGL